MRKWKRKLEVANRRKQEKEEAWANELNRFRDGAHVCHTVLVAAVELA